MHVHIRQRHGLSMKHPVDALLDIAHSAQLAEVLLLLPWACAALDSPERLGLAAARP